MRNMMRDQLALLQGFIEHVHAEELAVMSEAGPGSQFGCAGAR